MRVHGYIRVSTDAQVEGLGLDIQRAAITAWAKAAGHRVTGWSADEGLSGTKDLGDRPGLGDALDAVRAGTAEAVVVYRLDRLARDLVLQEQLLAELHRMGGSLCSTSPAEAGYLADDTDDPSRRLIRQVLGAVSEYEASMIRLRMRNGRRRKAAQGGYAYGAPAYGTTSVRGSLVAVPAEAATLTRIAELHAAGESLRSIAATLTAEGHKPRRSTVWHVESLRRILARQQVAA